MSVVSTLMQVFPNFSLRIKTVFYRNGITLYILFHLSHIYVFFNGYVIIIIIIIFAFQCSRLINIPVAKCAHPFLFFQGREKNPRCEVTESKKEWKLLLCYLFVLSPNGGPENNPGSSSTVSHLCHHH